MGMTFTYRSMPMAGGVTGHAGMALDVESAAGMGDISPWQEMNGELDVQPLVEAETTDARAELERLYLQGRPAQIPSLRRFLMDATERGAHLISSLLESATNAVAEGIAVHIPMLTSIATQYGPALPALFAGTAFLFGIPFTRGTMSTPPETPAGIRAKFEREIRKLERLYDEAPPVCRRPLANAYHSQAASIMQGILEDESFAPLIEDTRLFVLSMLFDRMDGKIFHRKQDLLSVLRKLGMVSSDRRRVVGLTRDELQNLYKVIWRRSDLMSGYISKAVEGHLDLGDVDGVKKIIRFGVAILQMSDAELTDLFYFYGVKIAKEPMVSAGKAFKGDSFLSLLRFTAHGAGGLVEGYFQQMSSHDGLVEDFRQMSSRDGLVGRLAVIGDRPNLPAWIRDAVTMLTAAIPNANDEVTHRYSMAITGIERFLEDEAISAGDPVALLLNTMSALAVRFQGLFQSIDDQIDFLSHCIFQLPEPLREIAIRRAKEGLHSSRWELRDLAVKVIVMGAEQLPAENHPEIIEQLLEMVRDRAWGVSFDSVKGVLRFLTSIPTSRQNAILRRLNISDIAIALLRTLSKKEGAFRFLHMAWPFLPDSDRSDIREKILQYIEPMIMEKGSWHKRYALLLFLSDLAKTMPEWRTRRTLNIFTEAAGGMREFSGESAIQPASSIPIPDSYYPILIDTFVIHFFSEGGNKTLTLQLLNDAVSSGTLQQVVGFFRLFNSLAAEVRADFEAEIEEDTRRTLAGMNEASRARLSNRLQVNPNKITSRLKQFLIRRFVKGLALPEREKVLISSRIQQHAELWSRGNFISNMASLQSFSTKGGKRAIASLVRDLTTEESFRATRDAGSRRLLNPGRYASLNGIFPEPFVRAWSNSDKDFVVPLGELESEAVLSENPLALRQSRYGYTLRQMAAHLDIHGASHVGESELADKISVHFRSQSSIGKGFEDWAEKMVLLMNKMKNLETISEAELEEAISFMEKNKETLKASEVVNDLKELKKNINAGALKGPAWLVISSDPAGFLNLGREPLVTCQDPTRCTSFNDDGEPVNRVREGRFRYAVVIIDEKMRVVNGIAEPSSSAKIVARTQLEITTETGEPIPTAQPKSLVERLYAAISKPTLTAGPKLLVERLYAAGGFIYSKLLARKLREFASNTLSMQPENDVFIQFDSLGRYPPPLPDKEKVYRDTYH